jgi:hypothetical protein
MPVPLRYSVYEADLDVGLTLSVPGDAETLIALPDPRASRALSRAGCLLIAAGLDGREALAPFLELDPFRVGIYCAVENGPNDYGSAREMVPTSAEDFAATYRRLRSAKQYFKQLANVPAAQLGIFLGVNGPLNVFNHSERAALHALEQAEEDLGDGVVEAALVCSAFSLEDPLVTARTRQRTGADVVLSEAAACILLVADGELRDWRCLRSPTSPTPSWGLASPLVTLCQEESQTCQMRLSCSSTSSARSLPF